MKLTLARIDGGEEEVIVRYRRMNGRIEAIMELVKGTQPKITAVWEGQTLFLDPSSVYYLETVDGTTYAYLKDKVVRIAESLRVLEIAYADWGFFRCSKSMVLNIYKISYLKSEPGNRIRATMENGEQVIISRKYGRGLRMVLKGGGRDEA